MEPGDFLKYLQNIAERYKKFQHVRAAAQAGKSALCLILLISWQPGQDFCRRDDLLRSQRPDNCPQLGIRSRSRAKGSSVPCSRFLLSSSKRISCSNGQPPPLGLLCLPSSQLSAWQPSIHGMFGPASRG